MSKQHDKYNENEYKNIPVINQLLMIIVLFGTKKNCPYN